MNPAEVAEVLEASGIGIVSMLKALTPEIASWHPAQGEWCVNECVGHIIEAEKRGFAGRIRIILGAQDPDLPTWDRTSIAHARKDCDKKPSQLAGEIAHVRNESVELIRSLNLHPVDAGPLQVAGHIERMTVLLLSINKANNVKESGIKVTGV